MFAKTALIALALGAQVSFAAPVQQQERSLKAIGTAVVGGAASLLTGAILNNKRSESGVMVDTETGVIYMEVPDAVEGRSLKAVGTAIAGGIASGVAGAVVGDLINKRSLTAIENFIGGLFNKRSEPSGLMVDTETGVIYMEVPDANEGRSLKAVGTAIAGGIASGVAGAVVGDLINKREPASGLMVDTETGVIYADVPDVEGRSLKAVGTAIAGGIASGAAGALVKDILNKREPLSGLMVDTDNGVIYMNVADPVEGRSLKAVGTAIAGGIASGVAGAVVGDLINKREPASGLMVDTETGVIYADVPDVESRSLKAVGAAVAGGIASGAAGAIVGDLLNKREPISGLMVDTETGVIYADIPDTVDARSLKAVGAAVAGGIASGAAGAIVGDLLNNKREEVDARSFSAIGNAITNYLDENVHIAKRSEELDARSLSAIENFFKNLKRDEQLDARSLTAIGNFISGLFNKRDEVDARSLSAIENFFKNLKRDEQLDARSLTAIGNFISGLFNKRSELEEVMAKRAINDLE